MTRPNLHVEATLDARRKELDLSWAELAARIGISSEALRQIRRGRPTSPDTARALDREMGWTLGSLERVRQGHQPRLRATHRNDLIDLLARQRTLTHAIGGLTLNELAQVEAFVNIIKEVAAVEDHPIGG